MLLPSSSFRHLYLARGVLHHSFCNISHPSSHRVLSSQALQCDNETSVGKDFDKVKLRTLTDQESDLESHDKAVVNTSCSPTRYRYRLMIEFDGTSFFGWARQPLEKKHRSVHEALADAAARLAVKQSDIYFYAAGRTDSGVHALACVAHVDFDKHYDAANVQKALNSYLLRNGDTICVVHAKEVSPSFHARFDASQRRYFYLIQQRGIGCLNRHRAWHLNDKLNVEEMDRAAKLLVGTKDFSIFRSAHCSSARGPVRTISAISFKEVPGGQLMLNVRAPSFFMHQVRSMVGCLALVGNGKWSVNEFEERVRSCDRKLCAPVAPPQGLYFAGVLYPDFNTDYFRPLLFGEVGFES